MDLEKREIFKEIIGEIIVSDDFDSNFPRSIFREVKRAFSKKVGFGLLIPLIDSEETDLEKEFLWILDELKVEVREKSPFIKQIRREQKRGVVTPAMLAGAQAADYRHRQMLGDDY